MYSSEGCAKQELEEVECAENKGHSNDAAVKDAQTNSGSGWMST